MAQVLRCGAKCCVLTQKLGKKKNVATSSKQSCHCWSCPKRETQHSCVQTEPRTTREAGVQGRHCCDAEVQASPQGVPAVEPRAYDWPSLATFMRQAYPKMIQELEKSSRSSAFRGYRLLADTCEGSASRLYCDMTLPRELHCTGSSWNATGSVIALSYPFDFVK
ncbi:cytoplasmic dynein 2 intermediate chain 2-like [Dermacentor silvarum]|uniref:cytoplasmic dynein 2 intermediate chain 2-like n=1 Tax=Dermacentor silvarum TaxID=543639 RepID=UPI002100B6D1|nr:cytoplasmic dynein 2 intermediate chain 2-like [Dermacentor silvarum]